MKKLLLSLSISILGFTVSQTSVKALSMDVINITGSANITDTSITFLSPIIASQTTTSVFSGYGPITSMSAISLKNPFHIPFTNSTVFEGLVNDPFIEFNNGIVFQVSTNPFSVVRQEVIPGVFFMDYGNFTGSFIDNGTSTTIATGLFTAQGFFDNSDGSFSMTIALPQANSTTLPDESSTIALLGSTLVIIGFIARRKK